MIALRWRLRHWAHLLGWQGIAGIALAAAAAGTYFGGVVPARGEISRLEQEVRSLRAARAQPADATGTGDERWLSHFYSLLPARDTAPDSLRVIFSAARAHGLTLDQGEYKTHVEKEARLVAYAIGLPVRGSYVQVRRFIGDVLARIPSLALDEVAMKRESIGDPRVEASIRFTLFLNAN